MIGRIAGAVMGGIGSLLGSKGEEGRGKDFFKSVAKGAITGPVGTGLLKGVKERRQINKAEKAEEAQELALNAFMANQPAPVDLNQGNPEFISPQQTPGS
jgi:outer membrane lipoprotein SlyB